MGQNLSEPKTDKKTDSYENELFAVGASCMQGWRLEMEDAHTVQLNFAGDPDSAYFGVFDGHGGQKFSHYCSKQLHHHLQDEKSFRKGDYEQALKSSFLATDRILNEDPHLRMAFEPGGTTALVSVVRNNKIYCANVGDSRAVTCVAGEVQELSHDHKPYNPVEESRIYRAGGWVEFNRVNGNLALSRAIGDFNFKSNPDLPQAEQIVTADPEVITVDLTPDHEFVVLACDGVWDVMSNVEVIEFVRKKIAAHMKPQLICEALLDHCLAPDCRMGGVGCDNMTVIIACFLNGDTFSELALRCSKEASRFSRARFSSLDSIGHLVVNNMDRRLSEPTQMRGSPVITSKLATETDIVLPNGPICNTSSMVGGKTGVVEEEEEGEEEDERFSDSVDPGLEVSAIETTV